ncbi:hypothetical protein OKW42_004469 [Paraburkholderia sp. WC7.3d]
MRQCRDTVEILAGPAKTAQLEAHIARLGAPQPAHWDVGVFPRGGVRSHIFFDRIASLGGGRILARGRMTAVKNLVEGDPVRLSAIVSGVL